MNFRTLLVGAIAFGIFSGTFAQWSLPFFLAMGPDTEIETSQGPTKCRHMRTSFDAKDAPPSCTSVAIKEMKEARKAYQREYDRQMDEAMSDPEMRRYIELRERREADKDSIEAAPLD